MSGLLRGVRVVETGVLMTVDYLGRLLGDEGADVVKVESPQQGDYLRNIMTRFARDWSAFHLVLNRNKRSVAVDARTPGGREVMARLIAGADAFITGNVGATNEKLGLDYEAVRRIKPDIVYCQATGYGASGPYAEVPTHGQMMDDLGGAAPALEVRDGVTRIAPGGDRGLPLGVVLGPMFAALGVAAGLARAARTGEGCYLDVSCADAVLASQWIGALPALNPEKVDPGGPVGGGESAKYQRYETKDGRFLLFCAIEPKFWDHFCRAVERDDLLREHRRDLVVDFAAGDDALRRELQAIFRSRTLAEWMAVAVEHDIAMGPSLRFADVQDDPHLAARGMIVVEEHPAVGSFATLGNPVLTAGEPFEIRSAPAHGEHTADVLAGLGYDDGQREQLRREGVIR
ncbi:MAG TPA: CoA transferase [Acidimicrobiales bacterium]|nr:CoA transferase [Acidimicrobiales bacterium]